MSTVCGAVIARDESRNIERCLRSLEWTDSLLVVLDDRTVDATAALAESCGARVEVQRFVDYARQRNAALKAADAEWVLFVDADEVVTPELAAEVRSVTGSVAAMAGYWIPRKNILFGHWVRHTGWSPDYQLRLLRRRRASYREDRTVHELVELDGESGHLLNPLIHYNYRSLGQFLAKQRVYAAMEASDMFQRGVRVKPRNHVLQPWRQFWRRYVLLQGYRDGWLGLLLSVLLAYYEFRTYLRLRSLWRSRVLDRRGGSK
jgi:(heptosyl)LPS beta-1,4-glucosyltransferase